MQKSPSAMNVGSYSRIKRIMKPVRKSDVTTTRTKVLRKRLRLRKKRKRTQDKYKTPAAQWANRERDGRCELVSLIIILIFSCVLHLLISVFSLFTVVRFANEPCPTGTGGNGTCYTRYS